MRISQILNVLEMAIENQFGVGLVGQPGIGKTQAIKQACLKMIGEGRLDSFIMFPPGPTLGEEDAKGLPEFYMKDGEKRVGWVPPDFFPTLKQGRTVVLIDDAGQMRASVQSTMMQPILEKRIGSNEFPNATFMLTTNRSSDKAGAQRINTALANRIHLWIQQEVNLEDCLDWGLRTGKFRHEVRSYLNYRPSHINTFEDALNSGAFAFASPRSWEFASEMLPKLKKEYMLECMMGCIGSGVGKEFVEFYRFYDELPDIQKIKTEPGKVKVPVEPAVQLAVCGALVEQCRDSKVPAEQLNNIIRWVGGLSGDYNVLFMIDAVKVNLNLIRLKEGEAWVDKHKEILLSK